MQKNGVSISCKRCGEEFVVPLWKSKGHTTRCDNCRERHGRTETRLYQIWENMSQRTTNKNNTSYELYGALGISVCIEWKSFLTFESWSLSNGYSDELSIDRINGTGNYEPNNCRWVNQTVQARNVKQIGKNNSTGYKGVSKKRDKFSACITVDRVEIRLGAGHRTAEEAARAYNKYVLDNNLEHTLNKVD